MEMAGWRWSIVVALGVCCFALPSRCQLAEEIVADFSDITVADWVKASSAPQDAEISSITKAELPETRPGYGKNYTFCTLSSCASSVSVRARQGAPPNNNLSNGVLYLDMRYKAIRGVNSTMMTWMFENMAGKARYAPTNETFDMYLIFHPRDHVFHKVTKINGKIARGARLTWCEMILSRCTYKKNSAAEPWVCPADAKGFLRNHTVSLWAKKYKTKETMRVNWFNGSRGIEFSRLENNDFLGPTPRVVATTRHTWSDNAKGTALVGMRTQTWIGLMAGSSSTVFDTTSTGFPTANLVNQFIADTIMGGTSEFRTNPNATALGYMNALHFVEEYGGLNNWLPDVWKARTAR